MAKLLSAVASFLLVIIGFGLDVSGYECPLVGRVMMLGGVAGLLLVGVVWLAVRVRARRAPPVAATFPDVEITLNVEVMTAWIEGEVSEIAIRTRATNREPATRVSLDFRLMLALLKAPHRLELQRRQHRPDLPPNPDRLPNPVNVDPMTTASGFLYFYWLHANDEMLSAPSPLIRGAGQELEMVVTDHVTGTTTTLPVLASS